MPACRVYLFTYKRNHLLPRAVESLINQTFTDWVCEVHNDCPGDEFPGNYIRSLKDDRFLMKDHPVNLGPIASFNLAYKKTEEKYLSILEDDNWWEPDFLKEMTAVMENNPAVNLAWCNMQVWIEQAGNQWINSNTTTWPGHQTDIIYTKFDIKQAMGALHSNGSMLCRGNFAERYIVPPCCDFAIIEPVRERAIPFPIYFSAKIMANFSNTLATSRSANPLQWTASQLILLASYIKASPDKSKTFMECLNDYRKQKPTPVANFFLVNLLILKDTSLYKLLKWKDWLMVTKWLLKNGARLNYMKKLIAYQADTYQFLLENTQARYKQIAENITS